MSFLFEALSSLNAWCLGKALLGHPVLFWCFRVDATVSFAVAFASEHSCCKKPIVQHVIIFVNILCNDGLTMDEEIRTL